MEVVKAIGRRGIVELIQEKTTSGSQSKVCLVVETFRFNVTLSLSIG